MEVIVAYAPKPHCERSPMRMDRKLKRLVSIAVIGAAAVLVAQWATSHPYLEVLLWPDETIWGYKQSGDRGFLMQLARSPLLPRDTRREAIHAAVDLGDLDDSDIILANKDILALANNLEEDVFSLTSYQFFKPFIRGHINPVLADAALDSTLWEYERLHAFARAATQPDMTPEQAEQICDLWTQLDSEELQDRLRDVITYVPRCGESAYPSNLVKRFTQDEAGEQGAPQVFSKGRERPSEKP